MHTLTRVEVARRLGRSIATVRRLEFRLLFPMRDQRGVFRFDEAEVERVRRDPSSLRQFARSPWFEDMLLDDTRKHLKVSTGFRRSSMTNHSARHEFGAALADDLQASLYALLLRFDAKQQLAIGIDADLFERAFEVIRRLRNLGSQVQRVR